MNFAQSFEPFVPTGSRLIILGTMPGKVSLEQAQYYAHPQNAFWKILFKVFDTEFSTVYSDRIKLLRTNRIALWDVLQDCERSGSLDSNIVNEKANDFETLFSAYPQLETIAFNGQNAEKYFRKHVGYKDPFRYFTLPSTSPANATKNFEKKFTEWQAVLSEYIKR